MNTFYNLSTYDSFFDGLRESLPPVFTRKVASEMTGGLFSVRGLSNLDSAGKGPSMKLMSGRTVLYEKNNFLNWLCSTIKPKKEVKNRPRKKRMYDRNSDEVLASLYPHGFQHTF